MRTKIFAALIIVFVLIQFIRPDENQSKDFTKDITTVYTVPADVQKILQSACYDCHSNYTTYPWYNRIQPVAYWLNHHINEGKHHLNFSEFAAYEPKKQAKKLKEISKELEEGEMPLDSYTWMHKDARLSKEQVATLTTWAKGLQAQVEATLK